MENINYDFSNKDELKKYIMTNIQEYDLRINKLKEEIFELIFTNIPEDRKNGNAEVPIVRSENSDFQVLNILNSYTKIPIPENLRNLDSKPILHKAVCKKEDIKKELLSFLYE